MNKRMTVGLIAGVLLITGSAFAESDAPSQPAKTAVAVAGKPATAAKLPLKENPFSITYGVDGRYRGDNYSNFDETNASNDEGRFGRWRTRLFANVSLGESVDAYVRVGQESWKRWYQTNPATGKSVSVPWSAGDIWFDNAYLNFQKLPGLPGVSLRVGRQDILKGDGYFMNGGKAGLGPKAAGFDAFVLGYTHGKQKLELMGIWDPQNDDFYPDVNQSYPAIPGIAVSAPPYLNVLGTMQAIGTYYTGRQYKNTDIDGFAFFVKEYGMSDKALPGQAPSFAGTYNNYQYQPDRHLGTFGGRIVERLPQDVVLHGNFTAQMGTQDAMSTANSALFSKVQNPSGPQATGCSTITTTTNCGYPEVSVRAYGFLGWATKYFPKVKTQPYVRVVTMLNSGQDPKNLKTAGNFDSMFGQWAFSPVPIFENGYSNPLFSDSFVNNQTAEVSPAPAYLNNMKNVGFEAGFTPLQGKVRKLQLIFAYQHVDAFHPFVGNPAHYYLAPGASFPTLIPGTGGGSTCTAAAPCAGVLTGSLVPNNGQFSQTGTNRYQLFKPKVFFVLSKNISGHLTFEKVNYGDYYNKTWYMKPAGAASAVLVNRANTPFFRMELNYRFDSFKSFQKSKL